MDGSQDETLGHQALNELKTLQRLDRERACREYGRLAVAYDAVARIYNQHQHDGDLCIGRDELKQVHDAIYRWSERMAKAIFGHNDALEINQDGK